MQHVSASSGIKEEETGSLTGWQHKTKPFVILSIGTGQTDCTWKLMISLLTENLIINESMFRLQSEYYNNQHNLLTQKWENVQYI